MSRTAQTNTSTDETSLSFDQFKMAGTRKMVRTDFQF